MATRRLSSIVHGKKNEAFDASLGNEAQLAKLGYEQGTNQPDPPPPLPLSLKRPPL